MSVPHSCDAVVVGVIDTEPRVTTNDPNKSYAYLLSEPAGGTSGYSLLFKLVAPNTQWANLIGPDPEFRMVKATGGVVAIAPTGGGTVNMRLNATSIEDMGSIFE